MTKTQKIITVVTLVGVFMVILGTLNRGTVSSASINIDTTQNTPACITFRGHGTDEAGNLYILGADGEHYELPLTSAVSNANPNSYPSLEAAAATVIEKKFCLAPGQVEVDIEGGKYVNITWYNR